MQCPDCGANQFYAKDPEDQYTISEFRLEAGVMEYVDEFGGTSSYSDFRGYRNFLRSMCLARQTQVPEAGRITQLKKKWCNYE